MLWHDGLETFNRDTIITMAYQNTVNPRNITKNQRESAIRYAVFHYLGHCFKSPHNHFAHYYSAAADHQLQFFVAIDNDRCLTPETVKSPPWWKKLVFDICHFPRDLVHNILQAANMLQPLAGDDDFQERESKTVSERLVEALQGDPLSGELLASQPEAFVEIDHRVRELANHMKHCKTKGKRWSP